LARFTNDQRILKELMERLIKIHYMEDLLDLRKKDHIPYLRNPEILKTTVFSTTAF